jgi:pSer/pThr/pTyr-binding forkhead associated (FHA) protein
MTEKRAIIGHARHPAQGPHFDLPAGFVPLRLCVEAERLHIEIVCPIAIVGRHTEADVRFAYPDVSRRHCQLVFDNGQWRIFDLKSLNGVFVNNVPAAEATLYEGDQLRIGCVKLLVESGTPLRISHEKLRQIAEVLPAAEK